MSIAVLKLLLILYGTVVNINVLRYERSLLKRLLKDSGQIFTVPL